MISFDYMLEWIINKFHSPYDIIIAIIIAFFLIYYNINKKIIHKKIEFHQKKFNLFIKGIILSLIILSLLFFIYDNFYYPEPSENQLVVAISPFYYIDKSGKLGYDINTAYDFKEKLEAENLSIKTIILREVVHDMDEAKFQGKKVGAHLIIYGETKEKIGNIGEIRYYILPLSSLESLELINSGKIDIKLEESKGFFTQRTTFSMVTEQPISIIESLKDNASSFIYLMGGVEKAIKWEFPSAITFFKSIKNYENNTLILYYIATCYYEINDLNETIKYLDEATYKNPHLKEAWSGKGYILFDLGRYEEALASYDEALKIDPKDKTAWLVKGNALSDLNRYEEALASYDEALKIDPEYKTALYNRACIYSIKREKEKAISNLTKAIEIDVSYKEIAKKDKDFENLWKDEDFKKLVGN